METKRPTTIEASAKAGVLMGLFWVFKYLFVIFGGESSSMASLYIAFTMMVPYVAYRMTTHYRTSFGDTPFGFLSAWSFVIYLFLFAGLIVSLVHFYYYKFVIGTLGIAQAFQEMLAIVREVSTDPTLLNEMKEFGTPTPILMTTQQLINNIMAGIIIGLPIALFTRKKQS